MTINFNVKQKSKKLSQIKKGKTSFNLYQKLN